MNGVQIHLALNHVPVIGVPLLLVVFAAGAALRSSAILRLGLWLMLAVSLAAGAAYFSGEPAEEKVEHLAGVVKDDIEAHEDSGKFAVLGAALLGLLAAGGLLASRGKPVAPKWGWTMVAVSVLVAAILLRTAHLGGLIRHPELKPGAAAAAAPADDDD